MEREDIRMKQVSNSYNHNMTIRWKENINKKNTVILIGNKNKDAVSYGDSGWEEITFIRRSGCFKIVPGSEAKHQNLYRSRVLDFLKPG